MLSASQARTPASTAEQALIHAILSGDYPPGTALPAERGLAAELGVTRPTLREVLGRLERDGWISIQHGKATRVNDYWREGGLGLLQALVKSTGNVPVEFIPWLLEVRQVLGPAYVRRAVTNSPEAVVALLAQVEALGEAPEAYATFDWTLHRTLTELSGNPIYSLILNGFAGFYEAMAVLYFADPEARGASARFYRELRAASMAADAALAERLAREILQLSVTLWRRAAGTEGQP
jgi:GntR family transcriptional regulator, negative regulator for fad regulon and positive regulator of fabA